MSTSPARRAAGGGAGSSPTSPTETSPYVKDSFVPRFDNTISGYKEWRKRVQLYARRLELQGRSKEVAMNVLAVLEGSSWTQCEDIDLKELEAENGLDVLLRRLDSKWKYDERVELGSIFDTFFFKVQRKPNQSLLDYVTDFHQALRDVQRLKVDLPEEITGWLMLRRAALTKDQQHLVQSQVGKTLTLGNMEQSLFLVFGQDFKQSNHQSHRGKSFPKGKGRSNVHHAEDDEHEFQDDWNENYMDTYYENDDDQYYECDEEWDETYFGSQVDWSPTASEWNPSEAAVEDESLFDVEEFDSVYSAYADAKSRLAQLRQSRGFYPVVALVDGKGSSMSQGGGSSKSKGQSKKGSKQSPYPPKGKGIKARGKAIAGDLVCLRCGKTGHKAANCKSSSAAASGASSPAKKRPIDLDPMVNMVFQASGDEFHEIEETYMQGESVVRAGGWVTKEPDMCIQDQGASSFLAGSEYILRYLKWLEVQGYPMNTISFKKCNKSFRFGGDADGHARWMVELPVHFANISGRMQCFIVFGATPMLLGRPVLEQLGAVVDFGSGKMRILGGRWTEIERGKQDAMLLRLAATFNSIEDFENPQFDLRAKDDDHDDACSLQDFLQDLRAAERYEEMISEVQFTDDASENEFVDAETYVNVDEQVPEEHFHAHELTERTQYSMSKTWSWIQGQLVETSKKAAQLAYEARCQPHPRKKLIWEVYSGTGLFRRTSWTPWCRCDAFWTQQWMGLLQISTSKTFDGTGLWAWAGWDLHVSQVHTLVSHAGHQHALWSWLGWTLGATWLRPWDPSEVLQEAVLVSGETWSSCTHWTSTPQCCLGNTSLCQTSRWTHNFWSMWVWLHYHSWWWWSTNHENHLHSDHKTCDVSHHVQTMLRQPSTCPTWRWKPLQEGWELPMRACLEFSSCPSWRWGFVGTGLCCSTRRRSSRADWSSSKTWHKAWLWSGAHCLPPPSKPWASEKGHFGPHAAGQECRPKGHRCSRSPWVPLLQQVFFQETISSSSCRASHGLQWAASGRHLVVWFELSWAWCPFWQSFQAEDWHVGHGWFCNSLHGCAIHSWWIKQLPHESSWTWMDSLLWPSEAAERWWMAWMGQWRYDAMVWRPRQRWRFPLGKVIHELQLWSEDINSFAKHFPSSW